MITISKSQIESVEFYDDKHVSINGILHNPGSWHGEMIDIGNITCMLKLISIFKDELDLSQPLENQLNKLNLTRSQRDINKYFHQNSFDVEFKLID